MKKGWQTKTLGDVCEKITQGPNPKYNKKQHDDFRVLKTKDLYDDVIHYDSADRISEDLFSLHHRAELKSGDVLLAIVGQGSINKCNVFEGVTGKQFIFTRALGLLRPNRDLVSPYFVKHFLQSSVGKEMVDSGIAGTSGQQVVTTTHLKGLIIPIPPLDEQQRIVGLIDEAFEGIATAKANAEKNLQNARALFESHLQSVFSQRGEGWVETTLGKVCNFVGGSQPPKSVFSATKKPEYVRLIQIRDYKSDKNVVYIPRKLARRFCDERDVMIGRYGPPLFQILRGLEGAYNVALMKAVPDEAKVSHDFLFYFLKNSDILQYIIYHSQRAAGQIGLTKETLEPYPFAVPSLAVQKTVVETIMKIEEETQRLASLYTRKLAALEALKKSLLHQAFSGEL